MPKRPYRPETPEQKQRRAARTRGRPSASRQYKYKYGVTADWVAAKAAAQDHRCAICKNVRPLCVDHNHVTGALRDLLCKKCNTVLGFVGEDPAVLTAAARYLEAHRG